MKEVFSAISQNGRWGISIVSGDSVEFPAEGSIEYLGKVSGIETFLFKKEQTNTWVVVGGDLKPHKGGKVVISGYLQGLVKRTILLIEKEAIVEEFGYKGKSSHFVAYTNGNCSRITGPVLLALGLIKPDTEEHNDIS